MKRTLGTCYYPEHWSRDIWEDDARRMVEAGLTWVRIGEFAWSRLEPSPGQYRFDWLDDAIEVLGRAGLRVVLGTPTATPPRWMLDRHPDMLARDAEGHPRKFGSRRHYCFSHEGYARECDLIVTRLAERYGQNPHVAAWQTDNEYGCHDTILSYSNAARQAFRNWLRTRYAGDGNDGDIDALNAAWGNVFWSMEYDSFDQIDLPNLTVTEPNPSHLLDFRRFSSDQVVRFNRRQVDILRGYSTAPIAHNYMGRITDFDHFRVGDDLEIASWDSYPLGFLEDRIDAPSEHKRRYARQGDPDFQALHHDLYRAVGRGRWWVMEQQPGPVNWAPYNPDPLPGMVRLWSWEAFAHGAEAVCYFRWRQAPMAQEMMHAGMLRPDSAPAPALAEARQVADELAQAPDVTPVQADVGLFFDYESDWAWSIQPHGAGLSYFDLVLDTYRALRKLGLSIDILRPGADLTGYRMICVPGQMILSDEDKAALAACGAEVVIGPRTAARSADMQTPVPLPPAMPGLDVTVARVESLRPDMPIASDGGHITGYRDVIETTLTDLTRASDGSIVTARSHQITYLAAWLDQPALIRVMEGIAKRAGLDTITLPEGVRRRRTATEVFWFNHDTTEHEVAGQRLAPLAVLRQPIA
ncbi:beta-galactosidase [Sagittula sp. SSi028]|uniref:beta-galactosidase n=1 Tax=Sagittula sp. SSi028 TaxID=3400636 RepID=UPI003AF8BA1B